MLTLAAGQGPANRRYWPLGPNNPAVLCAVLCVLCCVRSCVLCCVRSCVLCCVRSCVLCCCAQVQLCQGKDPPPHPREREGGGGRLHENLLTLSGLTCLTTQCCGLSCHEEPPARLVYCQCPSSHTSDCASLTSTGHQRCQVQIRNDNCKKNKNKQKQTNKQKNNSQPTKQQQQQTTTQTVAKTTGWVGCCELCGRRPRRSPTVVDLWRRGQSQ